MMICEAIGSRKNWNILRLRESSEHFLQHNIAFAGHQCHKLLIDYLSQHDASAVFTHLLSSGTRTSIKDLHRLVP